jgi:hypothetical protein
MNALRKTVEHKVSASASKQAVMSYLGERGSEAYPRTIFPDTRIGSLRRRHRQLSLTPVDQRRHHCPRQLIWLRSGNEAAGQVARKITALEWMTGSSRTWSALTRPCVVCRPIALPKRCLRFRVSIES